MPPQLSLQKKILSRDELLDRVRDARERGLRIVQCHGCFDIVHPGHIRHLEFASRQGDILLVSITGDPHIAKGTGRPLIPEHLRAENLAALNFVDWVCIDENPTALQIVEAVQPDIYLKGREYEGNNDPRFMAEKRAVERGGGKVVFSSGDVIFSSSALISHMHDAIDPFSARLRQLGHVHDLRPSTLESIVQQFSKMRVVVIGDTIIDTYVQCERPEVAAEGPILSLRPLEEVSYDGGAAIVCNHLAEMGAQVHFVTVLPDDDRGNELVERLESRGIQVSRVLSEQPIIEKQRFLVDQQKVMKLDRGRPIAMDEQQRKELVCHAIEAVGCANLREGEHDDQLADAVILTDFAQGMLTPAILTRLVRRLRPHVQCLAGDVSGRRANLMHLRNMDLVCPSEQEIRDAVGDYAQGLGAVVWRWFEMTGTRNGMVTLGQDGVIAFSRLDDDDEDSSEGWQRRLKSEHIPALGPPAIDQLGCGDAMLSAATLARCAGADLVQAAYLGSIAASIEARTLGNTPISAANLRHDWRRLGALHLQTSAAM